jgi:hypothetical protein
MTRGGEPGSPPLFMYNLHGKAEHFILDFIHLLITLTKNGRTI